MITQVENGKENVPRLVLLFYQILFNNKTKTMFRSHSEIDLLGSRKAEVLGRLDDILKSLVQIKSEINTTKEVAADLEPEKPRQKFYVDTENYLSDVDTIHVPGSSNSFDQVLEKLSDLRLQIQELQEKIERIGTKKPQRRFYPNSYDSRLHVVDVEPPTERRRP